MTIREAAARLEVSPSLLYKMCRLGLIGYHRVGIGRGAIRIDEGQLEHYKRSIESGVAEPEVAVRNVRGKRLVIPDGSAIAKAAIRAARSKG